MLRKIALLGGCVLLVAATAWIGSSQEKSSYRAAAAWLKLPEGFQFGGVTAVATDKDDNLFIFHRAKRPIAVFARSGKFLRAWGDDQVKTAHGLRIDHEGNVWTTDLGTHQVIKYDPSGKVLLTLGQKNKPGTTQDTFNKPADVAVTPAGDFYVADGYGNSRVVHFSKEGKYLGEWGKKGKAAGDFNLPHAIFLDGTGLVYVGDRENNRVQVFNPEGKFLAEWKQTGAPFGLFLQKNMQVMLADGRANRVRVMDLMGKVLDHFGEKGTGAGQFALPHGICVDSQGTVYVGEVEGKRVQKFVKS